MSQKKKSENNRKSQYVINYLSYWHNNNQHNLRTPGYASIPEITYIELIRGPMIYFWWLVCCVTDEASGLYEETSRILNRVEGGGGSLLVVCTSLLP